MSKIKINASVATAMLIVAMLVGWDKLLTVAVLMFVFCEVDDKTKDIAVKILTFYVGYGIVSLGWNLIMSCVTVGVDGISKLIGTINLYLDPLDYIDLAKLITTITNIKDVVNSVVGLLFTLAKLGFVVALISGKVFKKNVLSSKIDEYVTKALNFVSGNTVVQMQNVQPSQSVQPSQPVSPVAPMQQPVRPVQSAQPVSPVHPAAPVQPEVQASQTQSSTDHVSNQ